MRFCRSDRVNGNGPWTAYWAFEAGENTSMAEGRDTVIEIVFVEDEEMDVRHFQRLARKHGLSAPVRVFRRADDALSFLDQSVSKSGDRRHVIVTDLNMPGTSGHELVETIRADPRMAESVVFVISTSDLATDMQRAYGNNVAGFIVKDPQGQSVSECVQMLKHFCNSVVLPT